MSNKDENTLLKPCQTGWIPIFWMNEVPVCDLFIALVEKID